MGDLDGREPAPLELAAELDPEAGWLGRPAWVEIDLDVVAGNVRRLKRRVSPRTAVMAVVKGDGYGLGAVEIAVAALRGGATWLAVACADEGVQLRDAGLSCPILVLGAPSLHEAGKIVAAGLTATVHNLQIAAALSRAALERGAETPVHLKLDSGLNRFGHEPEGFVAFAQRVAVMPGLRLDGLYTHFASADQPADPFTQQQIARFEQMQRDLAAADLSFRVVHAGASAGAIGFPDAAYNMVRAGITLSGEYPSAQVDHSIALRPAVTIKARIMRLWTIGPGESVGYGRTYIAPDTRRLALLPIGYADGYPRAASNKTQALVAGRRCPLLGRVSMDQLVLDVSSVPAAREGDEAVLAGTQGDECVGLDEIAAAAGTISYELLTHLGRRLPRLYLEDGKVVRVRTLLGEHDLISET